MPIFLTTWHYKIVRREVTKHNVRQRTKRSTKNGKLPAKLAEEIPWNKPCVDLIGTYKIRRKQREPLILKAVTMIYPLTRWFEINNITTIKK